MLAQIYNDLNDNESALDTFYVAKSSVSKEPNLYINILFNIGLLESLKGVTTTKPSLYSLNCLKDI